MFDPQNSLLGVLQVGLRADQEARKGSRAEPAAVQGCGRGQRGPPGCHQEGGAGRCSCARCLSTCPLPASVQAEALGRGRSAGRKERVGTSLSGSHVHLPPFGLCGPL